MVTLSCFYSKWMGNCQNLKKRLMPPRFNSRIHVWVFHVLINDCKSQFSMVHFLHVINTEKKLFLKIDHP